MPPAHQRLRTAQLPGRDRDHGLVMQLEFPARDSAPQFALRQLLGLGKFQHVVAKNPDIVAAAGLGVVQGKVGAAQQVLGIDAVLRGERHADADSDASVYLTYSYQGRNWGLTWGGGASWEMGTDDSDFLDFKDQDFYQTGLNIDSGRFSIGGVFEYYNDLDSSESIPFDSATHLDAWVAGGGVAYTYRAWTVGARRSCLTISIARTSVAGRSEPLRMSASSTAPRRPPYVV